MWLNQNQYQFANRFYKSNNNINTAASTIDNNSKATARKDTINTAKIHINN